MADYRLEPVTELTHTVPAAPPPAPVEGADDEDFHCPNCLLLGDPADGSAFWACQNLCIRD
ncbi:MAG: hypothetical protein ACK46X_05205 [Candidatus Sericytochromatia bacterium]